MIDWILAGAVGVAVIIIIRGIITHNKLRKAMKKKNVEKSIVKSVNHCTNEVTLEDLNTRKRYVVKGSDVGDDVKFGNYIYV